MVDCSLLERVEQKSYWIISKKCLDPMQEMKTYWLSLAFKIRRRQETAYYFFHNFSSPIPESTEEMEQLEGAGCIDVCQLEPVVGEIPDSAELPSEVAPKKTEVSQS